MNFYVIMTTGGENMNFLKKYNIIPKSIEPYTVAFTHSSFSHEKKLTYTYERLEFLGDAVLELVVSEFLYNKKETYNEGEMTKLRSSYVCENALYEYAKSLDLSRYIKVGVGETKDGGAEKKAIMADVFEALLGAIYLDLGYTKVKQFVYDVIIPFIDSEYTLEIVRDFKSELQIKVQTDKKSVEYIVTKENGPAHSKTFEVVVKIDNIIYGSAKAKTKKEAEQLAARSALEKETCCE